MTSVFFDLRADGRWGDKSYMLPMMAMVRELGHDMAVMADRWNAKAGDDYDPLKPETVIDAPLYDPKREPIDFFVNLIFPSLGAEFYDVPTDTKTDGWQEVSRNASCTISYDPAMARTTVFSRQFKYVLSDALKNKAYCETRALLSGKKNITISCSLFPTLGASLLGSPITGNKSRSFVIFNSADSVAHAEASTAPLPI